MPAAGWVFAVGIALAAALPCPAADAPRPPNFVFILADDLGWGDLGCYGQQHIRTPNIDRLAREGMRFTRHYSGNAVCAPSRCVLMTGYHPGHAFIRDNRYYIKDQPGQYPLPDEAVLVPELLRAAGYATGGFGKWGLGAPDTTGAPHRQGVDQFFGYNCQGVAHNFFPSHLWNNDQKVPLANPEFSAHQQLPPGADPSDPASYRKYLGPDYAPDLIVDQALRFIRQHAEKPFWLFVPSTIPHLALQAPPEAIAEYAQEFHETPYTGDRRYLPQRQPRACYAAMVSQLDRHVGRLLALLEELKLADNTVVVFSSDNGPAVSGLGGVDTDFFRSAGDLRGRKGSLYEGGVRVPLVVRWPGHVAPGTVSDRVSGFEDWMPTLLEMAGQSEQVPAAIDGISLVPTLLGNEQPPRPFLYREIPSEGGQQALWVGDWKAVRQQTRRVPAGQTPKTELYHLAQDPNETTDLAASQPERLADLNRQLDAQHVPSTLFPLLAGE